jgi:hypothetical protein
VKGCTLSKMEDGRWKMVAVGVCRRTRVNPRVREGVCVFHFASAGSGGLTSGFNRNRIQETEERRKKNSHACGRRIIITVVYTKKFILFVETKRATG